MARYADRIRNLMDRINEGTQKRRRVYGVLGRVEADGATTVRVAGDPTKAHVRVQGQQAATTAFHRGAVNLDSGGGQPIILWKEDGQLHIEGYNPTQANEVLTSTVYARSDVGGPVPGIFDKFTSDTNGVRTVLYLAHITDQDMVDHLGVSIQMAIEDDAGVRHPVGFISGQRDGADNSGRLVFTPMNAGVAGPSLIVWSDGTVQMAGYGEGVATFDANGVLSSEPGGGGGASTLDDLTDVDVSSPTDNYVLTYDQGTGLWGPEAVPLGGTVNLDDINDVDTSGVAAGEVLAYSGTNWVPAAAPAYLSPADVPPASPHADDDEFNAGSIDPAWSLVNQGASSSYTATGAGIVSEIGGDTTQMRPMVKAVPSGDFRFGVAIHEMFPNRNRYSGLALVLLNAAQTAATTVTIFNGESNSYSWSLAHQEYNPLSSRNVNTNILTLADYMPELTVPLYLRMHVYDDAGTWKRDVSYSHHGLLYTNLLDTGRAVGFTPAYMGWSMYDRSGSGVKALVRWFRVQAI